MISADDFTRELLASLRASHPSMTFEVKGPLELRGASEEGDRFLLSLRRLYDASARTPASAARLRSEFLAAFQKQLKPQASASIARDRIVPLLRPPEYFERAMQEMACLTPDESPSGPARGLLNERLAVAFAEDHQRAIRFLREDELASMGLASSDCLALALSNLRRIHQELSVQPVDGFYMISAGGRYEASLILDRTIWESRQIAVVGDYVFGIPLQETLFVTGSDDADGLARMDEMMRVAIKPGSRVISSDLFVLKNGRLNVFSP